VDVCHQNGISTAALSSQIDATIAADNADSLNRWQWGEPDSNFSIFRGGSSASYSLTKLFQYLKYFSRYIEQKALNTIFLKPRLAKRCLLQL